MLHCPSWAPAACATAELSSATPASQVPRDIRTPCSRSERPMSASGADQVKVCVSLNAPRRSARMQLVEPGLREGLVPELEEQAQVYRVVVRRREIELRAPMPGHPVRHRFREYVT